MQNPNRTALVTGSGRKIGRATALTLAAQGFNIVVNGSSNIEACEEVAESVRAAGTKAVVALGNVGVREEALAVAEAGIREFGAIDVLVNNAAVRPNAGFLDISEEEWDRVFNIDFKAAFWLSRACLPGMIERGWGRIINFTGMNAQQGYPGKPHVTVAKHAAWGLTKSLAREFGPKGVTANIISPGTIVDEDTDVAADDKLSQLLAKNPAGRLGRPDDIAGMVAYLASDRGGFVNGQLLQVNGGVVT
jgi:3-oxoacyl-[acyl-carrier protein] reductase